MHTCHRCLSEVKTVIYVYAPIKTKRFWWTWSWSLVGCSVFAISEEAEHINARRQLNMYLLYVTNCYFSLDSTVICFSQHFPIVFPTSFFVLCLLHFRRPYAHFFISINFDNSVIDLACSVCFLGVTCSIPSFFRWKLFLFSPTQSFTYPPLFCFFFGHFILLYLTFCLPLEFLGHLPYGVMDMLSRSNFCKSNMAGFPVSGICKTNSLHQSGKRRCYSF